MSTLDLWSAPAWETWPSNRSRMLRGHFNSIAARSRIRQNSDLPAPNSGEFGYEGFLKQSLDLRFKLVPFVAADAVDQRLDTQQFRAAFEPLAKPLGDGDRARVRRLDQADDVRLSQLRESVAQRSSGAFGGESASPVSAKKRPAYFEARPAGGIETADDTDELAGRFLFCRPHAIAAQLPVAKVHRDAPPRLRPRQRLAGGDVAHHLRVCDHLGEGVEVIVAEHAKPQAFGFERYHMAPHGPMAWPLH